METSKSFRWFFFLLLLTTALAIFGSVGSISAYDLYATGGDSIDQFYGINSSDASPTWLFALPQDC